MAREKILVVDDELEIGELIDLYLTREGFQVFKSSTPSEVLDLVSTNKLDLIILDILLPGMDGLELCQEIRKISYVPIIFISCKSDDMDIILGLSVGGDDYITKPFSPSQLVARVKAHLRRNLLVKQLMPLQRTIKHPGIIIDLNNHIVQVNGNEVKLSAKEFKLLTHLAQTPNRVYNIEHLFQLIWGSDSLGDTRTLMVHISNLRKKIEQNPTNPQYIQTVRGVGYKFNSTFHDYESLSDQSKN